MKTKPLSYRQCIALAILLPIFGAIPFAQATEHTTGFEADLGGWTTVKDTSFFDWARWTNNTPSGYTGPSRAYAGQYYLYLEASYGNAPGRIAYVESPNFEEAISQVTFHYHMYGGHMGTLAVEAFDGSTWKQVWAISGRQHASHSSPWTRKQIDLSGAIHKVRFKGMTGSGYRGDMAIDQVMVVTGEGDPPPSNGIIPHSLIKRFTCSSHRTDRRDIDLGLDNTNAKFLVAMVFSSHVGPNPDHANHFFGRAISFTSASWSYEDGSRQGYYDENEAESNGYVGITHNGDAAGSDWYGNHELLIIPLKENHRMDVRLCDGYSSGTHYIKLRAIGYFE
uniref:MAM domain-containing protein, meprin/A5/mu n=1 Tax=Candidatus Kentrum sp. LFY TaxID=2126342 RepID=A0A450ULK4_9GAMM|nr:MAG: MAM domain-containing protein, meprin/A5/mu [Candidatus Kentron sp. LFY]